MIVIGRWKDHFRFCHLLAIDRLNDIAR
jgi:hypothetical protein